MRFKIDENLPVELAELLRSSGHVADTVVEEHASGAGYLWVVEPHRLRLRGSQP